MGEWHSEALIRRHCIMGMYRVGYGWWSVLCIIISFQVTFIEHVTNSSYPCIQVVVSVDPMVSRDCSHSIQPELLRFFDLNRMTLALRKNKK